MKDLQAHIALFKEESPFFKSVLVKVSVSSGKSDKNQTQKTDVE